jgi:DNA-binding XRE family transcriptional regulator
LRKVNHQSLSSFSSLSVEIEGHATAEKHGEFAMNRFGEYLQQKLIQLNISKSALARELGVSRSTLNNWIIGRFYPDIRTWHCLAHTIAEFEIGVHQNDILLEMASTIQDNLLDKDFE